MKRIRKITNIILITTLFSLTCVGCGEKSKEEEYVIEAGYEGLIFPNENSETIVLGLQFHNDYKKLLTGNDKGEITQYVEGNSHGTVLLENVDESLISNLHAWWMDEDGYFFISKGVDLTVLNATGEMLCKIEIQGNIEDICRSSSHEVVLEIYDQDNHQSSLQTLDISTGKIENSIPLEMGTVAITSGVEQDLLIMDTKGVYDYNLQDQSKNWYMKWKGTTYDINNGRIEDIKYASDKQILLLTTEIASGSRMLETIQKNSLDSVEKTILTYQTTFASMGLKEAIVQFNQENQHYYVQLIECGEDMDYDTYREKARIEIATGHGADMINGDMVDNVEDFINKSVFEELDPYIEKAGLEEKEFSPYTLECWSQDNKVYGIGFGYSMSAFYVPRDVSETAGIWNLDSMMKAVEEKGDKVIFTEYYDSLGLLQYCLSFSHDLQGIINWETNTCDFQSENWKRLLEFTDKYGYRQEKNGYEELAKSASWIGYSFYSSYDSVMDENNMVAVGWPSDDDYNMLLQMNTLGMNSQSKNKEGVWEFISFLLRDDIQKNLCNQPTSSIFPVRLSVFDTVGDELCNNPTPASFTSFGVEGKTEGVTKEQVEEIKRHVSHAKPAIYKTQIILDIIEEEANAYFSGAKTIEEVSDILQNRVQLYLDEQKD